MLHPVGYGLRSAVQPDMFDPRDLAFSAIDEALDEDGATGASTTADARVSRLFKRSIDEWRAAKRTVRIHADWWCEHYRELADTTWHQRGEECTGFALAAIADYHFRRRFLDQSDLTVGDWRFVPQADRERLTVSRRMMYEMAQLYDRRDWEQGSTLRGALKGWQNSGVAAANEWPYEPDDETGDRHGQLDLRRVIDSVRRPGAHYLRIARDDSDRMKTALAANYPLFVNARLHSGWYDPYLPVAARPGATAVDEEARIRQPPGMKRLGGHAFVIVGYCHNGWRIHNSWGPNWGDDGYAVLPYEDFAEHGQDVWFVLPPPHREKRPVEEDRYLPDSRIAVAESELARAETGLRDAESRLAIARAKASRAEADAGRGDAAPGDNGPEHGPEHAGSTPDAAVADAQRALTVARDELNRRQLAIETSAFPRELHDDMWRHVLTVGDSGRLMPPGSKYGLNRDALKTLLWMFRRQTEDWATRRLAIFADGGYWSTTATVERMQPLRDALLAAEIYPIFLLWNTPWYADMVGWLYGNVQMDPPPAGEEIVARRTRSRNDWFLSRPWQYANAAEFPAPRMWRQLERRARAVGRRQDGAGRLLADAIAYNRTKAAFEIHLLAHGAGDLLLSDLAALLPPVASCNLWAPATTMRHFSSAYRPMLESGHIRAMTVHALEKNAEREDHTGPVPGSVLQLVSDVLAVDDLDLDGVYDELTTSDPVWPVEPEPLLGLHRHLSDDQLIGDLVERGLVRVEVVDRGTHIALAVDPGVRATSIERILGDPDTPRPDQHPGRHRAHRPRAGARAAI